MLLRRHHVALLCAVGLTACGAGSSTRARTPGPSPPAARSLALPANVPLEAVGPADPAQERVIRRWAAALRAGDVARAASYWAVPSRVQNGTPVLAVRTHAQARLFNGSLPCGAVVTSAGGHGPFTITTERLTHRPGAECGQGIGSTARTAIRVHDGHIVEWYRLPDAPGGGGPPPAAVPTGNAV